MPRAKKCCVCRKQGYGEPPLCELHEAEAAEEGGLYVEVVDEVLEHPQVRRVVDRAVGLLDQLAEVIDKVKHGELPKRPAAPPRAAPPHRTPIMAAREVFHFGAREPLTPEKIRARKHELAKMVHPDHGGSVDEMAKINRAADILMQSVQAS